MQPIVARWRFVHDTSELRLDPLRRIGCLPHGASAAQSVCTMQRSWCRLGQWPPASEQKAVPGDGFHPCECRRACAGGACRRSTFMYINVLARTAKATALLCHVDVFCKIAH